MAYDKTIWVNDETPVNADNMNKIEDELAKLSESSVTPEQLEAKQDKLIAGTNITLVDNIISAADEDARASIAALEEKVNESPKPLHYVGSWNASTNTPEITTPDTSMVGGIFRVSVAGTRFGFDWKVGDKLVYKETGNIEQWDVTDEVTLADLEAKQDKLIAGDRISIDGATISVVGDEIIVENNLTSTSTTSALSANQGRVLNEKIDAAIQAAIQDTWNGEY